ncbi:hypothetical protein D6_00234 [Faustovirus]|nr:hypothetical protein D6_00234 [Faustovirus]
MGYIYLIRKYEDIVSNAPIYKIGMTDRNPMKRMSEHGSNREILLILQFHGDAYTHEQALIKKFQQVFGMPYRKREYFKGDPEYMKIIITTYYVASMNGYKPVNYDYSFQSSYKNDKDIVSEIESVKIMGITAGLKNSHITQNPPSQTRAHYNGQRVHALFNGVKVEEPEILSGINMGATDSSKFANQQSKSATYAPNINMNHQRQLDAENAAIERIRNSKQIIKYLLYYRTKLLRDDSNTFEGIMNGFNQWKKLTNQPNEYDIKLDQTIKTIFASMEKGYYGNNITYQVNKKILSESIQKYLNIPEWVNFDNVARSCNHLFMMRQWSN